MLFVGSGHDLEKKILETSGYQYTTISTGKFRRYGRGTLKELADVKTTSKNIKDFVRAGRGIVQARKILRQFRPDVVFTKGGFVGLPVGIAAGQLKFPLVIHESDSVFGKANQILAKKAQVIAVSFPIDTYPLLKGIGRRKFVYTGNPIRSSVLAPQTRIAEQFFPFEHTTKPIVLITGSSQGAHAINQVVFSSLEILTKKYNLIHLTGENDIERARFLHHRLSPAQQTSYMPFGFLQEEMGLAYQRAEVVVARASMSTLMEIAAVGRPGIIIPLPSSADQPSNARILSRLGAIRLLEQKYLTSLKLQAEVDRIFDDPEATDYLVKTFHKFYKPDAAQHLAKILQKIANKHLYTELEPNAQK